MSTSISQEYNEFILNNRKKVNGYLNMVLWLFVLTGPAIAMGVAMGIFPNVTYITCCYISTLVIGLSALHLIMLRNIPHSFSASIFALTALDILLFYMCLSEVSIRITWFLVPFLSLLFCERGIYYYAFILNFITMFTATYVSYMYQFTPADSSHYAKILFLNSMGGFTIESLIMFVSGCIILRLASDYYKGLIETNNIIETQKKDMLEKVQLLDAVVRIFDNVNLINFITRTETSLKSLKKNSLSIDFVNQSHTVVNTRLQKYIIAEQHEQFMEFTNLHTLRERLICRNIISEDFISSESGWIRAQYITVSTDDNGLPSAVIYITRNVDSEKKKEAYLLEISMTDALTGLYNRRSYDKDKLAINSSPLPENLVLFSMDVNNLKTVNDTLGHNIGDELIKNASRCLSAAIGPLGTVYRVGGDEFFAIAITGDPEKIRKDISELTKSYDGTYPNQLNISVGYASLRDHPEASYDELENLADVNMYEEKDRYYRENHIDRRRRRRASG